MTQGQTNDIKVISFSETVILLYCNAWCELALSKKQSLSSCFKNPKPIFPFQKL